MNERALIVGRSIEMVNGKPVEKYGPLYTAVGFAPPDAIEQANERERASKRSTPNAAGESRPCPTLPDAAAGHQSTRRASLDRHRSSGAARAQCARLLRHLAMRSDCDWTRQELARALGWGVNVVCARVDDVRDQLRIARKRPCTVTHQTVEALRLAQQMEIAA